MIWSLTKLWTSSLTFSWLWCLPRSSNGIPDTIFFQCTCKLLGVKPWMLQNAFWHTVVFIPSWSTIEGKGIIFCTWASSSLSINCGGWIKFKRVTTCLFCLESVKKTRDRCSAGRNTATESHSSTFADVLRQRTAGKSSCCMK